MTDEILNLAYFSLLFLSSTATFVAAGAVLL